jgi:dTDP-glucose pyrophosphorylase
MKALILAGGRGKRLDALSKNRNKCMVPIAGRPAIQFSLDTAASTTVDEIIIVVGYRAEEIINHYGNRYRDKRIRYVIQYEQKGLVHAIECAGETVGKDDFMLMLGDEVLINPKHQAMIDEYNKTKRNTFALCGVLQVRDKKMIRRTYTLIQNEKRQIFRLVEKPRNPLNRFMGTGDCIFNNRIFDYIRFTPIHHERNEKELPDLIQCAIDDGRLVKSFIICDRYANINSKSDITLAGRLHI